MASFIFNKAIHAEAVGDLDYDTDTFKVMLVAPAATPNKDTWEFRDDVTNEIANGNGYTTGGNAATVSVGAVDNDNDRVDISLGGSSWPNATFTARYAVYYKDTGLASTDIVIAVNEFNADKSPDNSTFTLNASTLRKSNP